ncbi:MAG: hypothetical protein HY429_00035 [Candidatus Levybacteria bacterium]|nr:hypothetical protein [Candidatus Levybacteria bacterium]
MIKLNEGGRALPQRGPASLQGGQALLVLVLVLVVSLTVGLSVASRSITNVRISTEEENSQRALSAAEAGIEQVLATGEQILSPMNVGGQATIEKVEISQFSGKQFLLNDGNPVRKSEGVDVWFVEHNPDGTPNYTNPLTSVNINIFFGVNPNPGACSTAAIETVAVTGPLGLEKSVRETFDPCSNRITSNKFNPATATAGTGVCSGLPYRASLSTISNGFFVRVIPHYANTILCVSANKQLPSQGRLISSTAKSGGTARKITFFQGYPKLPVEFFPYVLLSP